MSSSHVRSNKSTSTGMNVNHRVPGRGGTFSLNLRRKYRKENVDDNGCELASVRSSYYKRGVVDSGAFSASMTLLNDPMSAHNLSCNIVLHIQARFHLVNYALFASFI